MYCEFVGVNVGENHLSALCYLTVKVSDAATLAEEPETEAR